MTSVYYHYNMCMCNMYVKWFCVDKKRSVNRCFFIYSKEGSFSQSTAAVQKYLNSNICFLLNVFTISTQCYQCTAEG